jgi:predicted amidohydrolase YtcJ
MEDPVDLVFLNGPVFTSDPNGLWAEAVGVRDSNIVAVGDRREIESLTGPSTEVVDLSGRLLVAGFQDAHIHPIGAGLDRIRCDLLESGGLAAGLERVRSYAAESPGADWVRGGGWKFNWFEGGLAPVELLDELVPDRPAYLAVADGHAGWANSRALELAGVDSATPDPPDGRIERKPDGSPQGTLQEGAMALVERVLPPNTEEELAHGLLEAQDYLLSYGITAWQDAWVTPEFHDTYRRLAADGRLLVQVRGALWWERDGGLEQLDMMEHQRAQSVPGYQAGSIKLMLDGVCENYTARLLEPYLAADGSTTDNCGIDFIDPAALPAIVTVIVGRGFQPHFHALGDAAVRSALDAVQAARHRFGDIDARPHVAHVQVVHPADVPRFATVGAAVNAQALWACSDETNQVLTEPFLGVERSTHQYPFGDLVRNGAHLAMGSDWAVSTPDVLEQIAVAVTRRVPGEPDSEPFLPHQRLSLEDALIGFTAGSAYVNYLEESRGVIQPGKVADLAVLEGNPFDDGPAAMLVDLTFVGGELVFER